MCIYVAGCGGVVVAGNVDGIGVVSGDGGEEEGSTGGVQSIFHESVSPVCCMNKVQCSFLYDTIILE